MYYVLKREIEQFKANAYGSKFDSITTRTFDDIKIPLPPKEVQTKIVAECEAVDAEVTKAKDEIADASSKIGELTENIFDISKKEKIANLNILLKRGKATKYGMSKIQVIKSGQARGYTIPIRLIKQDYECVLKY